MSIYSLKELRAVGVGFEGTYGVAGTISEWISATEENIQLTIPNENVVELRGAREIYRTYQKAKSIEGNINFEVDINNGIGVILKSFFGTNTSSQNGTFTAYRHTFTVKQGAEVQSMWASANKLPGTNVAKNYVGLVPNKLSFDFPKDDTIKLSASFLGQTENVGTVISGTYGTFTPFTSMGNLQVLIDGATNNDITNLKVDIDNGAKKISTVGTNNYISKCVYGAMEVTGSFDIIFIDEVERNKFINKTASRLQVNLTHVALSGTSNGELQIKLPKVEYVSAPFEDKDGVVGATVGFKAYYGANATGTGAIIAELQNTKANYN